MSDEIESIRSEHVQAGDAGDPHCAMCSDASYPIWPCDTAIVLARLDALTAERDALRGWQAGQTHYVGCWREHRRCALTTIDFEAARREHAELALREAVAELNRLREGHDDERR